MRPPAPTPRSAGVTTTRPAASTPPCPGLRELCTGDFSLAAGRYAQANHQGAFVWADNSGSSFASERNNQFRVRATGGARFDVNNARWSISTTTAPTSSPPRRGQADVGRGVDQRLQRGAQENFAGVDGQQVLASLADMPITTWNYRVEGSAVRHMGPTAQDFYAAFGWATTLPASPRSTRTGWRWRPSRTPRQFSGAVGAFGGAGSGERRTAGAHRRPGGAAVGVGGPRSNSLSALGLALAGLAVGWVAARRGGGR